ncbi:MAG TPA: hypothetical protein VFK66_14740 [Oryzihumus sp.]|nr:hypothetical protein [Oryzihumus sp.]
MPTAVLAVAVALLATACGPGADGAGSGSPTAHLELRLLTSAAAGPCSRPPLTSAGPGRACAMSGSGTYDLGPALAAVAPTRAEIHDDPVGPVLVVWLDGSGRQRLADVTRQAVGRRLAVLVQGRVLVAPEVQRPVTEGRMVLAVPTRLVAAQVAGALHASETAPSGAPEGP